jgi:hypothetical protein
MFAGYAQATPITLANSSFESDVVSDGASTTAISGWKIMAPGNTYLQVYNPTSADFASAAGNGVLPSPATGSQCLFDADTTSTDYVIESTPTTNWELAAGKTYTVTVTVGQGLQGTFHGLTMGYFDATKGGGVPAVRTVLPSQAPMPGTFADFSYSFTPLLTGKSPAHVGDELQVMFDMEGQSYIDNVRIDDGSVPVPEPSTSALLTAGLIGLLAYAWRRRRWMV